MRNYIFILLCFFFINNITAHPPWGIAVDSNKNIYFPDILRAGGSIWMLDNQGKLHRLLSNIHAHNVSLDKNGNIITAHGEENHILIRISPDGLIDTLLQETNHRNFFGGNCAWSPTGEVIFGARENKKLGARDLKGNIRNISPFEFSWNQTIYVDDDGIVYAPDIGLDNGIIVKVNPDGRSEVIATDLISKLKRPKNIHNDVLLGISKDSEGHIYVAETAGKQILKIVENGGIETFYRSEGDWFPCGLNFHSGEAYILESIHTSEGLGGPRIVKVNKSGVRTILYDFETTKENYAPPFSTPSNSSSNKWPIFIMLFLMVDVIIIYLLVRARRSPSY